MEENWLGVLNMVIDFIFGVDIIIAFRTAYIDDLGNLVNKPSQIAKNYLSGAFLIDLLATLPLD